MSLDNLNMYKQEKTSLPEDSYLKDIENSFTELTTEDKRLMHELKKIPIKYRVN